MAFEFGKIFDEVAPIAKDIFISCYIKVRIETRESFDKIQADSFLLKPPCSAIHLTCLFVKLKMTTSTL